MWAAGNGGLQSDHCGADGYVNSIYNIAIGAVSHTGKPAYFGEPCPGVMAVTLSGARVGGSLPLVTVRAHLTTVFIPNEVRCIHTCVCVCVRVHVLAPAGLLFGSCEL